jgi:hypothetical protein
VVTAKFDGSTTAPVTGWTPSPEVLDTAGSQTVTITYAGKTTTFNVTVKGITDIQGITVTGPSKDGYAQNEISDVTGLDLTGLAVTADYGDGVSGDIASLVRGAPGTYLSLTSGLTLPRRGQRPSP